MLKPRPRPASVRKASGHMYYLNNSTCSWRRTDGHVPGLRSLLKQGLVRELKFLDSRNSALSASPHSSLLRCCQGSKRIFYSLSRSAWIYTRTHTCAHAHMYTCLCTHRHSHAYMHICRHTQIRSRYQACHLSVTGQLLCLHSEPGLDLRVAGDMPLHVAWMELRGTSLEELRSGEESPPLFPPLPFFLLQTPKGTPSLFLLPQGPTPDQHRGVHKARPFLWHQ